MRNRRLIRRVLMGVAVASLLVVGTAKASAGKSCGNCAPTTVIVSGTVASASTTAVPNGGCVGLTSPTKYACSLHVYSVTGGVMDLGTDGGPTSFSLTNCPCTAQFWVHAGQWQPYSAMSVVVG